MDAIGERGCHWLPLAVRLTKEAFWPWLAQGTPEPAERYRKAKRAAVPVVVEAISQVWEEFGEEGLSVGLKEVLVNHQVTHKGQAGVHPGSFQQEGGDPGVL